MIRLPYTGTFSLELITAQNGAAVVVFYSDDSGTIYPGGVQASAVVTATTTTICSTPAASTVRDIDYVNIKNTFAGAHLITVQLDAATVNHVLKTVTLQQDESLNYSHGSGWNVITAAGVIKSGAGAAVDVTNTPAGNIAATTVQAALNELDAEKAKLAGDAAQVFSVAPATTGTMAVPLAQTVGNNRFINSAKKVDQRNSGAAQTIVAGAALAYTVDRYYAYCTGANVTGQQVAGSSRTQKRYQFTGAASVTAIGYGTRLEAKDTYDLNSQTVSYSVDLANSLLTTVTWTLSRATTTDDTFGTLAAPTVTQIATGTFTITSTITRYQVQISVPSAATTGLQMVLSVGAQTSGTWIIGDDQLEVSPVATTFEQEPYSVTLAKCQRYYYKKAIASAYQVFDLAAANTTTTSISVTTFPVPMRIIPTALEQSGTATDYGAAYTATGYICSSVPTFSGACLTNAVTIFTFASGLTAGYAGRNRADNATTAYLAWSTEL